MIYISLQVVDYWSPVISGWLILEIYLKSVLNECVHRRQTLLTNIHGTVKALFPLSNFITQHHKHFKVMTLYCIISTQ